MKKLAIIISVFLITILTTNTITTSAQQKSYSQGFYNMKDLDLYENRTYTVQNITPPNDGWLVILDSNKNIQQLIRIQPDPIKYPLMPLRNDYKFAIYGDIKLVFS